MIIKNINMKAAHKIIAKSKKKKKVKNFEDQYMKVYSDNQYIKEGTEIDDLVHAYNRGVDFAFYEPLNHSEVCSLRLVNMTDCENSRSDYNIQFQNFFHLRFGSIVTNEEYRKKHIMSYSVSKIILTLLKNYPQKNIFIDLANTTSISGSNPFKIYDSILFNVQEQMQYRLFSKADRESDILEFEKNDRKLQKRF
ncbi:hypothetical protein [Lactococcus garvieae]